MTRTDVNSVRDEEDGPATAARPQSLMLSFLGLYVLGRGTAVYSGSVIDVFARLEVSEDAARSTLARMVKRDLLVRHRRGRKMYFGLTERAVDVLRDGHDRIWSGSVVEPDWDGTWTLVGFSLPESRRSLRHDLRSRLVWAGFGPLQNGLWAAPGRIDVPTVVAGLDLDRHLNVLRAQAAEPTEAAHLLDRAFDTAAIAARSRAFLAAWDTPRPMPAAPDDLARQLLLHTDWLQLVRSTPRLPADHLPEDWPAVRAEQVFRKLSAQYDGPAGQVADAVLDVVPADTAAGPV
ncbi:PaaX family transcriptional regulator [Streptomyces sp. cg35]|uniref:PaaX family transcriptional regulator n=1 Tax=Streptomyces sp. cg35 TaxID=3421650 RepID=UPI003D182EE6